MIKNLKPFVSIGEFVIGGNVNDYKSKFNFEFLEDEYDIGQEIYNFNQFGISLFVSTQTGVIESVLCENVCLFKSRNLIGMSLNDFMIHTEDQFIGEPDCIYIDEIPQYVYEFEKNGLQVWAKDNIIVTIIANGHEPRG